MPELPTGTVTFLFSDIEGSTKLVRSLGDAWPSVLDRHAQLVRAAVATANGIEVSTEGDSFFIVFSSAADALSAAATAQRALAAEAWGSTPVRVRMGIHTGEALLGGDNYLGLDVHRAARIASAAHGGQVLLSEATRGLVARALDPGMTLRDLGLHRLKDLPEPEHLFQVDLQGLPSDFPPPHSMDARPNNLPPQLTSFVGRRAELDAVRGLLGRSRLVTLTGPGGTGKTRLSLEVAAELLTEHADGAFFVDLSALTDPALVASTIADALSVVESAERAAEERLVEHLGQKDLLLVLDNFEQVLDAAPLVSELLKAASHLRVLVTSREALHVEGEQEFRVPPLGLPDTTATDPATLGQYEAVALFIERGLSVRPDFVVTNESAPAVAEIASRLDGLPLAIELAAAWVNALSPPAILERLQKRLPLLRTKVRGIPDRQRTLQGAIAWSYDLLEPHERALFDRLSIFAGGSTLEAAEAVCGEEMLGIDVLDGMSSLVDKSLLRRAETDHGDRYVMLETIREFGMDALVRDGAHPEVARRHAEHFLGVALQAEPNLTGPDGPRWLDGLTHEHDNLRAALGWTIRADMAEIGLPLAGALWRFWHQRAHFREARAWFDRLLTLPSAAGPSIARAKGLTGLGGISYWQGDYETCDAAYTEALTILREAGDEELLADALWNLSNIKPLRGDLAAGSRLASEAAERFASLGNVQMRSFARGVGGYLLMMQGDLVAARPPLEENLAEIEAGDRSAFLLGASHHTMGQLERRSGNLKEAIAHYHEAIRAFGEAGDKASALEPLEGVALIASARGEHDLALRLTGAVEAARDRLGGGPPPEWLMRTDIEGDAGATIGQEAADRARAEGRALSIEEATALALSVDA